jgi:hypothetical protein
MRTKIALICLTLALAIGLISLTAAPIPTQAASPIRVVSQSFESNFRQNYTFTITAESTAGEIVAARVIWRVRSYRAGQSVRVTDFTPAKEVTLTHVHRTSTETTPPWQVLFYRWELTDSAGNTLRTEETKAEVADDTRDWQRLENGKVAVFWYARDVAFGERLLDVAQRGYDHVQKATGFTPDDELRVVVFNSQADFCSFYAPRTCQDWVGGVAMGSVTLGWLDESTSTNPERRVRWFFENLIPHELAHAFLNYALGPRIFAIPNWFNEGQAVNNELSGLEQELDRVREIAMLGQLERLPLMEARTTIGRNELQRVADWYAQAASLVAFLYERWGLESLGEIVKIVRDGKEFKEAMETVTGLTMDEYEIAWREWLGLTVPPPTLVPEPTIFFPPTPTAEPTPIRRP